MEQIHRPAGDRAAAVAALADKGSAFPVIPRKFIVEDHSLVEVFIRSASFEKIIAYVQGCCEAVESTPYSQRLSKTSTECCPAVRFLVEEFFPYLNDLVTAIPLEDLAQQRFGNHAKRVFHEKFNATVVENMEKLVRTFPPVAVVASPQPSSASSILSDSSVVVAAAVDATATTRTRTEEEIKALALELAEYAKDSWGNSTRLDYGSGHELHFFVFIMICLEEHGDMGGELHEGREEIVPLRASSPPRVAPEKREETRKLRQDFIFHAFWEYIIFVRRLQKHYSLEPAGSHGVWGLDDYHHLPYAIGASQLIGKEEANAPGSAGEGAILPKHITEKSKVMALRDEYMYFAMIAWIIENKIGPFYEHSNMLYNISGVQTWRKIYTGMIKMFAAEVLGKFNVSQHLLFGKHLPWNTKQIGEAEEVGDTAAATSIVSNNR